MVEDEIRGEDITKFGPEYEDFGSLGKLLIYQLPYSRFYSMTHSNESKVLDSTGCRVYVGAHVLARFLGSKLILSLTQGKSVIELGCGTGMVGIASCESMGCLKLCLTDGNELACQLSNLNIESFQTRKVDCETEVSCKHLFWSDSCSFSEFLKEVNNGEPFNVVIGCELIYYRTDVNVLLSTVYNLTNSNGIFVHSHVFRSNVHEKEMKILLNKWNWKTLVIPIKLFISESELSNHPDWYQVCTLISGPTNIILSLLSTHSDWKEFESYEDACQETAETEINDVENENNVMFHKMFE